jgi:hypothetical protein
MDKPLYLHGKIKKLPANQPILKPAYNYLFRVMRPFKETVKDKNGHSTCIVVPKDFMIDGASIPRTFWRIIGSPFTPMFQAAATIHDYAYKTKCVSRKLADKMFKAILRKNTVSKFLSQIMYMAVRTGGVFAYGKETKK